MYLNFKYLEGPDPEPDIIFTDPDPDSNFKNSGFLYYSLFV